MRIIRHVTLDYMQYVQPQSITSVQDYSILVELSVIKIDKGLSKSDRLHSSI